MRPSSALRLLRTFACFAAAAAAAPAVLAQSSTAAAVIAPTVRVVAPVSNTQLTTLKGNVHPLAQARYDQGAVAPSTPTGRMMLLLRRSPEQQTALHRYLDDLQNPASPNYRKWLTPETLGKTYGISDADLAAVKGWLESEGFRIEKVPAARNMILFSGTVSSVTSAFHTSIHSYLVGGEKHLANAADPQIPSALAPVIAGIAPMNDFRAKPAHTMGPRGVYDPATKRIKPQLTLSSNQGDALFVVPADAATIYNTPNSNLNAHYSASASRDGSGVTLGIVGYSNINLTDVLNYRTAFLNDADTAHLPNVIIDGDDPGVIAGGYAEEALLDNEIAGGLAPGATINYYAATSTDLQDGLALAILRALDDNQVSILSVSYGNCESTLQAGGNLQFLELWEQAASQGITVTVSTGDSGSAGCDDPNSETVASGGLAVSGIASTPYNVAVGGTDFAVLGSQFATYVNDNTAGSPPYYETALSYIPEVPWNDSVATNGTVAQDVANSSANIVAAGGGRSSLAYCAVGNNSDGSCSNALSGYPKPAFQSSITGSDGVRDIPDVSLFASNGQFNAVWALCSDNVSNGDTSGTYTDCETTGGVLTQASQFEGVGGTSASTPAMAGILALVSQDQNGARLGQADNVLYNLAANHYGTVFHDTTVGNNSVPCASGTINCGSNHFLTGYDTAAGYDLATGLGSVNATALLSNWSSANFTATATTLGVSQTNGSFSTAAVSVQHGTPLYFNIGVSPTSATGDVSVTNTSGVTNSAASFTDGATLTNGAATYSSNDLPGGSYTISAYYGGDATHAASTSSPAIDVNISSEPSTTSLNIDVQDPATSAVVSSTSMPYGFYAYANVQPYGNNSPTSGNTVYPDGVPTGTVTLNINGSPNTLPINSIGAAQYPLYAAAPGSYTFQATYGGDTSFQASTSTTQSLTITKGGTQMQASASNTSIGSADTVQVTVLLFTDSYGNYPTQGITLTANGHSIAPSSVLDGTGTNSTDAIQATFTVSGSQLAAGSNVLTANYAGDTNYSGSSATVTINVSGAGGTPSFSLAPPSSAITISAPGQSGSGTVTLAGVNNFSGTVSLTCSVSAATSGVTPTCSLSPTSVTLSGSTAVPTTLTISTTANTAANTLPLRRFFTAGGEVALGCLLLLSVPARRRSWRSVVALLFIIVGVGAIGCGGSSSNSGGGGGTTGTPTGTYTVTVTGTSGSTTANTSVSVTVQ